MKASNCVHHIGLYIHIPVCSRKCSYCDFYSISQKEISDNFLTNNFWQNYFNKLKSDLDFFLPLLSNHARLGSIFFGGGTPSLVPPEFIENFLVHLFNVFSKKIYSKVEITLEANPENISSTILKKWYNMKINRIHVGLQSNNQKQLHYLERQTSAKQNIAALCYLQESPFANYGTDIMYGLPYQTDKDIIDTLHSALVADVTHISAYELTLEEGTPLYRQTVKKEKPFLNETAAFTQNRLIENFLASKKLLRYEVSNYAKNGYESLHNNGYWKFRPYIGLGASAHSFLYNTRYVWSRSVEEYLLEKKPFAEQAMLTDFFIGALRLYKPQSLFYLQKVLSAKDFEKIFSFLHTMNLNYIKSNEVQEKPLTLTNKKFSFSPHVINFSNDYLLQAMKFFEDRL